MFLVVGGLSLLWGVSLRWLSQRSKHNTHYRLQEASNKAIVTPTNGKAINVNVAKAPGSCAEIPWRYLMREPAFL